MASLRNRTCSLVKTLLTWFRTVFGEMARARANLTAGQSAGDQLDYQAIGIVSPARTTAA